jgi:hypothetical protein
MLADDQPGTGHQLGYHFDWQRHASCRPSADQAFLNL